MEHVVIILSPRHIFERPIRVFCHKRETNLADNEFHGHTHAIQDTSFRTSRSGHLVRPAHHLHTSTIHPTPAHLPRQPARPKVVRFHAQQPPRCMMYYLLGLLGRRELALPAHAHLMIVHPRHVHLHTLSHSAHGLKVEGYFRILYARVYVWVCV